MDTAEHVVAGQSGKRRTSSGGRRRAPRGPSVARQAPRTGAPALPNQVDLLDTVNDAVIAVDPEIRLTAWNRAAETLYGWAAAEVLGRDAGDVMPTEFVGTDADRALRSLVDNGQWSGEILQQRRDGTAVRVEAKAIAFRDPTGAFTGFVSVNRDITDRKRAEDALRASEARFRLLIEHASDMIMIVNADGTFRYLSPAHERRVFGYFHPEDLPAVIGAFRAVAQSPGVGPPVEFRVRHRDGTWRVIEAIGNNQLDNPGIQGVVVNARDITGRKAAEEALRYRVAFEQLLARISTSFINLPPEDTAAGLHSALRAIGEFFQIDRGYIVSFSEQVAACVEQEWYAVGLEPLGSAASEVLAATEPWWAERRSRLEPIQVPRTHELPADGGARGFLLAHGIESLVEVPMVSGGSLIGVLGLAARRQREWTEDDLTLLTMAGEMFLNALQRQRAEQERIELERRLLQVQKLEAVGRLAGGVAHDFNNQLTIIKGCAQFLSAGLPAGDPLRDDAERIQATVDRGAQLVRQLLAFSSEQPTEPHLIDLGELVEEMAPMLRLLLGEQVTLVSHTTPERWPVLADPVQIERVILNLVANAKDAMPESREGGYAARVTLETIPVGPDYSFSSPADGPPVPGDYVMLAVHDNGCGMTTEVRQRIFEPYFTTKAFGRGTGLGLSTTFGIVKQHGGYISCVSQPGQGTTFRVFLSREPGARGGETRSQQVAPPVAEVPAPPPPERDRVTHVLVVEDEEQVRTLLVGVLRAAGYEVRAAGCLDEAMDASLGMDRVDLLVTDVAMPGGSGLVLARRLREAHPHVGVLFISGYPERWDIAGTPGARFLQKPFSLDLLLSQARQVIEWSTSAAV
ncbi:PAS domain S-box protein [Candidatus Binatia bacterium]|nr:PAS domain S-box protein [Candidatus Binatia bacterium]